MEYSRDLQVPGKERLSVMQFFSLLKVSRWMGERLIIILGQPGPNPATPCLQDKICMSSLCSWPELTVGRWIPNTCLFLPSVWNALASPSLFDTILFWLTGVLLGVC